MASLAAEDEIVIEAVDADEARRLLPDLGALLHACVHDGASIGFVLPFSSANAESWWRTKVLPALVQDRLALFVARIDGMIIGTAQLDCDTPANQPHRTELRKMLVHPTFRRRGIARRLLAAAEGEARRRGRRLITLDTRTGDMAEPLYASAGFATAGVVPFYCLDPFDPDKVDSTTIMYKRVDAIG
ncbi:MAG: GNAT family N-acetyltransferase [Rhizobiaceae bacterium]|nr:GNAT family N-acetyltransferase [Rhizobiaceae bacterium]MCV0405812.1 GNAT family N-acetyltransferase [Rhizobiaceae bacterium]